MRLVFSPLALRHLDEIQAWIAYDNPSAAARVVTRIRQSVEILGDFPRLGHVWEDGPTRVLMVSGLMVSGPTASITACRKRMGPWKSC
jgi:plasmid stabilization system protein ParE